MIECRRELELPSVVDTEIDIEEKLASLVLDYMGYKTPGVGIRHAAEVGDTHQDIHEFHKELMTAALKRVGSNVVKVDENYFASDQAFSFSRKTGFLNNRSIHVDTPRISNGQKLNAMEQTSRLHTASLYNGTHIFMANTSSSFFDEVGDESLFYEGAEAERAESGYEFTELFSWEDRLEALLSGADDPLVSENLVFSFDQLPLHSVFFRLHATFGPTTIHKFTGMRLDLARDVWYSDIVIASQTL